MTKYDEIKLAAFYDELEKNAGFTSFLLSKVVKPLSNALTKLKPLSKNVVGEAGVAATRTKGVSQTAANASKFVIHEAPKQPKNLFGKSITSKLDDFLKNNDLEKYIEHKAGKTIELQKAPKDLILGLERSGQPVKPWFSRYGKNVAIGNQREFTKPRFRDNPLTWGKHTAKSIVANTVNNVQVVNKEGLSGFFKREFALNKRFSKTYNLGDGRTVTLNMDRSPVGKAAKVGLDTGIGFGALEFATNKTNEKGVPQGLGKRLFETGKEVLWWGPFQPLALTKATVYDLPKMGKELINI